MVYKWTHTLLTYSIQWRHSRHHGNKQQIVVEIRTRCWLYGEQRKANILLMMSQCRPPFVHPLGGLYGVKWCGFSKWMMRHNSHITITASDNAWITACSRRCWLVRTRPSESLYTSTDQTTGTRRWILHITQNVVTGEVDGEEGARACFRPHRAYRSSSIHNLIIIYARAYAAWFMRRVGCGVDKVI